MNYQFRRCFGFTLRALIENLRFTDAVKLLKETNNIEEISLACGYIKIGTFRNAFKRRFGYSPLEIREQIMQSTAPDAFIQNLIDFLWINKK